MPRQGILCPQIRCRADGRCNRRTLTINTRTTKRLACLLPIAAPFSFLCFHLLYLFGLSSSSDEEPFFYFALGLIIHSALENAFVRFHFAASSYVSIIFSFFDSRFWAFCILRFGCGLFLSTCPSLFFGRLLFDSILMEILVWNFKYCKICTARYKLCHCG
jgi:hypothetical protein